MNTLKKILLYEPGADEAHSYRFFHWAVNILALLVWAFGLGAVCLYFARPGYGRELFFSYFETPLILFLNIMPVLIITLLAYLLSNRVWITTLASGALVTALSLTNYFKLLFRGDPLLASDAAYFSEAAKIGEGYNIFFDAPIIAVFITVIVVTILSFFIFKAKLPNWKFRGIGLAAVIVLGAALYISVYRSADVYIKTSNLDIAMSNGKVMSQWSATDQYVCRGFFYPLIHSTVALGDGRPDGYDKNAARSVLASYPYDDIPEDARVSVIAIMLEAFNDFSALGVEFETDPYEFFHELEAESLSGRLVANVFAGDTIDTERVFITGSTVKYEYRKSADSFARYFKDQGYYTEFCHPCYGWFYNRQNVYNYLGFDAEWFYETRYAMPEGWGMMHDEQFFTDLAYLFDEATKDGSPYFNFSVTYQNHGPYDSNRRQSDITYLSGGDMTEAGSNIANNYFAGISETDAALRKLITHFKALDKPVAILIFGDHNPWMGDGAWVYSELGIDINLDSDENFYNYFCVPYVIWANDAAKAALGADFIGEGEDISPCFLMSKLFNEAGWGGDEFMKINNELRSASDIFHKTGVILYDGYLTEDLPEEHRALFNKYQNVQYYRMRDRF